MGCSPSYWQRVLQNPLLVCPTFTTISATSQSLTWCQMFLMFVRVEHSPLHLYPYKSGKPNLCWDSKLPNLRELDIATNAFIYSTYQMTKNSEARISAQDTHGLCLMEDLWPPEHNLGQQANLVWSLRYVFDLIVDLKYILHFSSTS